MDNINCNYIQVNMVFSSRKNSVLIQLEKTMGFLRPRSPDVNRVSRPWKQYVSQLLITNPDLI